MLHVGILPFHGRWATFLRRLHYVVVDELHVFRGIFGTHVAHVLRRLRRLCARYGALLTFIFSSATIGEPAALASALCGLSVRPVVDDGSPRGERLFALWNPPLLDADTGTRGSTERRGGGAHRSARRGRRAHRHLLPQPQSHRDRRRRGPTQARRRPREPCGPTAPATCRPSGARSRPSSSTGSWPASWPRTRSSSASTSVGSTRCVLDGFPGTVASMWQQAGRAGARRSDRWPCSSRAPTSSTSGSWPTRARSSPGPPSPRS